MVCLGGLGFRSCGFFGGRFRLLAGWYDSKQLAVLDQATTVLCTV